MKIVLLIFFIAIGCPAWAAPIYSWEGKNGVRHYASKPNSPKAQEAKLPEIMRGEMKLAEKRLVNCDQHGGVNCQAGADSDGSVVCYDGFRDVSTRFLFSCTTPKLEVSQISPVDSQGMFNVIVRNKRAVIAEKPKLTVRLLDGSKAALAGPDSIEPFGNAEFAFKPSSTVRPSPAISPGELDLSCANCP